MEEHESEYLLVSKSHNAPTSLILAPGPNYVASDARFLQDDLELLVDLGLLRLDYNSSGNPLFRYTRAASTLLVGYSGEWVTSGPATRTPSVPCQSDHD